MTDPNGQHMHADNSPFSHHSRSQLAELSDLMYLYVAKQLTIKTSGRQEATPSDLEDLTLITARICHLGWELTEAAHLDAQQRSDASS